MSKNQGWLISGPKVRRKTILGSYFIESDRRCIFDGAKTITIFGSMNEPLRRLPKDGLKVDWEKVGGDMRTALAAEKRRREREAV